MSTVPARARGVRARVGASVRTPRVHTDDSDCSTLTSDHSL